MSASLRTVRRKRTLKCQRVVAVWWLALLAFAGLNYVRELGVVGPYAKHLLVSAVAAMAFWWAYFAPRIDEVRAYQRLKRRREDAWLRQNR